MTDLMERPPGLSPSTPPEPPRRGGLAGWIIRRPRWVFWCTLTVALLIGTAIGASGGVAQQDLDAANAKAAGASAQVAQLTQQREELRAQVASLSDDNGELTDRVKSLSAKGEVPDFTGQDVGDARDAGAVADYDWHIKTRAQISDRSPGTVIAQSPAEGQTLKAGRSITLTVAKKAPPKPKQWVTLKTFQGDGATKTPEFTVPDGSQARLVYEMPQDGNNAITLYQAPDEYVDLLLKEIGPKVRQHPAVSARHVLPGRDRLVQHPGAGLQASIARPPQARALGADHSDVMLSDLRADLLRLVDPSKPYQENTWSTRRIVPALLRSQGAWAVAEFRFRHWTRTLPRPLRLAFLPVTMITYKMIEILCGISIATGAEIGPGFFIVHYSCIFVGPIVAGANLSISQGVTIGIEKGGLPTMGEHVYLAPGVQVFGPITMGDRSAAGANAVVNRDVPAEVTVAGVPAKPIGQRTPAIPLRAAA